MRIFTLLSTFKSPEKEKNIYTRSAGYYNSVVITESMTEMPLGEALAEEQ